MMRRPIPEPSSAYLNRTSRNYAIYVMDHRSIPSITDGLKSSQRIALHLIRSHPALIRTSAFAGEMVKSELYIHGNVSAEDAVSRLAAPYLNNRPLIHGEGAFGTRATPNRFGAARYTHVGRNDFSARALYVDVEIVPEMENYDGSKLMPATFLPLVPLILLNGISGIAVGWSTKILPRSFSDICAATLEYVRTGKIANKLLPKYEGFQTRVSRGDENGKFVISGRFERIDQRTIKITEIPIMGLQGVIQLEDYRETLIAFEAWGLIDDFTDRSKEHIDIEIKLAEPGAEVREVIKVKDKPDRVKTYPVPKWTDDAIYDWFGLRFVLTERIVALGPPDRPGIHQYESAQEVVEKFVDWRLGWYRVRYERLARLDTDEELFQRCIMAAYDGKVPDTISKLANKAAMKEAITAAIGRAKLELREDIVERLSVLPGYRWTKEGRSEAEAAAKAAEQSKLEHMAISKSPSRQKRIYEGELEAIAKL